MALDWEAIKTEYITTDTSQSKLAAKYGCKRQQIGKKCRDEGWVAQRRQYVADVLAKTLEHEAGRQSARLIKLMDATGRAIDVALGALMDDEQFKRYVVTEEMGNVVREKQFDKIDTKALKDVVGALKELTTLVRDFENIPTPAQRESQRIAAARLELERQKAAQGFDDDNDETGVVMIPEVRGDG